MKQSMKRDYGSFLAAANSAVDGFYRYFPRKSLTAEEKQKCRIIAHRGCWGHPSSVLENTVQAFEAALACGAWGIEFDIQWTLDNVPVVIHEPNTSDIPGCVGMEIGEVPFDELRELCPSVPAAQEVIERYGGRMHLMIELKGETVGAAGIRKLSSMLTDLRPAADFHLIALDPEILQFASMFPSECLLLISTVDTRKKFRQTLQYDVGGLTGHYLLLNSRMRRELEARGLKWGTGYVDSKNLLAREIRSGTEWIFTESAASLVRSLSDDN